MSVGAGSAVFNQLTDGGIGRVAAVILFMGALPGAHLNPVVILAFVVRGDCHWRAVAAYLAAQIVGAGRRV